MPAGTLLPPVSSLDNGGSSAAGGVGARWRVDPDAKEDGVPCLWAGPWLIIDIYYT